MNNIITCEFWALELAINPDTGRIDSAEIITTNNDATCIDFDIIEKSDGWHLDGYRIRDTWYRYIEDLTVEIEAAQAATKHFQTVIHAIESALAA